MRDKVWFGRCIFLSWYCERGTCKFCYRSTVSHKAKHEKSRRSLASILTDAIIGKNLGWPIEFLTGGYGIFPFEELVKIAKHVSEVYGHKIWINLGVLKKDELIQLKPFVEGVCSSIETVNPAVHKDVCPDKDLKEYEEFLELAGSLGFQKSMTIVIGLGETKDDFPLLKDMISRHNLDRITFYALKPVKGTSFTESPEPEYYAWWIEQTRNSFPDIKIMAGLTPKRVDYVTLLLKAGADSITKFPAIRLFNSEKARQIESLSKRAGRTFLGSLTKIPDVDWQSEIDHLSVDQVTKDGIKTKLFDTLAKMRIPKE